MKQTCFFGIALAIVVSFGLSSCGKSASTNDLTGTWNVRSANGDSTATTEPYIEYVVWAETFEQGGAMTFDTGDSVTLKMPPLMKLSRMHYSVLPNNKLVINGLVGGADTSNFKIDADTLWMNSPTRRTSIVMVRGASGS